MSFSSAVEDCPRTGSAKRDRTSRAGNFGKVLNAHLLSQREGRVSSPDLYFYAPSDRRSTTDWSARQDQRRGSTFGLPGRMNAALRAALPKASKPSSGGGLEPAICLLACPGRLPPAFGRRCLVLRSLPLVDGSNCWSARQDERRAPRGVA